MLLLEIRNIISHSITWLDITGDSGHSTAEEFMKFKPSVMVTQAYLFSKDKKNVRTFCLV